METLGGDSVMLSCVLIDPGHLQPLVRIQFMGRNQMKLFRIDPRRMAELLHMDRQQKVKRLESVAIFLANIELC